MIRLLGTYGEMYKKFYLSKKTSIQKRTKNEYVVR